MTAIELCPLCNLEGQILKKFWFKEKIYRCKKCTLIYRERIYSEKRNPDILAIYSNDSHKDNKNNGIKLFCNDIFKKNLKSRTMILDFGAGGGGNIKKLETILKNSDYNKDLIQYVALDIDLSGRYILSFSDKTHLFSDLSQVFSYLISKKITTYQDFFFIAHHVFEHVEDFNEIIIQVERIPIAKSIFFEVPAENQFILRTLIYYIARMPLYYIGHINFFNKKALEKLALKFRMDFIIKTRMLYNNYALFSDFIELKEHRMLSILTKVLSKYKISKMIHLTYYVKLESFDAVPQNKIIKNKNS